MNNPQLRKPSDEAMRRFLESQRPLAFTYQGVGATASRSDLPAGYAVDELCVTLGQGSDVFAISCQGIEAWAQFDLGWCAAWPSESAIRAGEIVAVVARSMGLWWVNAARIVYVIDEVGGSTGAGRALGVEIPPLIAPRKLPPCEGGGSYEKFGFAYGTLPGHVERGEELFLVEWDRISDAVTYRILAFSRPRHPLARIGRPLVRRLQQRFREDSAAAMVRWVRRSAKFQG